MPDNDETVALPPNSVPPPNRTSRDLRFQPGQLLDNRYRIVSMLGKGGMGEVYRADDLMLGQSVALKFLPAGADQERFLNEVKIARQVSHPNVCRVYDAGSMAGQLYLSMEYIDGEDLGSLLRRIGRLPADKAMEISRKLCAGLAAAHAKGVLHRDLKPGNIMLDARGQVLLTDFGLAAVAGNIEGAEIRSGTPAYMAPEQLAGNEVTAGSDLYALGLVLYEIFTGKRPYESDSLAGLVRAQTSSTPESMTSLVRDVDPLVERVILRCLDPDPAKRPGSALAVAAALPGGDPLAAALAAGETPSPQMVAAAGEGRGLSLRIAIPLLAATVLGLLINAVIVSHRSALEHIRPEYSADVLRVKAREILDRLGYSAPAGDEAKGFAWDEALLGWIKDHEKQPEWTAALTRRPGPIQFWYRLSPYSMTGTSFHDDLLTPGIVVPGDPPSTRSGMIDIALDARGRLIELTAMPPQKEAPLAQPPPPVRWDALFSAADLDIARFREAAPEWNFLPAADERKAWTGEWPGTNRALRIEAAAWRGRPVVFSVISDWDSPSRMPPTRTPARERVNIGVLFSLVALLLGGGALTARHNFKLGRVDRAGAMRLGAFSFAVLMAIWVSKVHLAASAGFVAMFLIAIATAIGWSAVLGMLYIAVEPFVRRLWPQSIISWSSVVTGKWRDPIVGRDVLAGIALGLGWRLFDRLVEFAGPAGVPGTTQTALLEGFRATLGGVLTRVQYGVRSALAFFLMLFFLRAMLRKQWLAAAAFVVVFPLLAAAGNDDFWLQFAANAVVYAVIAVTVVRLGLLSLTLATFTANAVHFTAALQPSAWYLPNALFTLALLTAIAVWACRTAIASPDS
jgi:serine/threonine-protein kinase